MLIQRGVKDKFDQVVTNGKDDIAKVLNNNHTYKELLELWYIRFLGGNQ